MGAGRNSPSPETRLYFSCATARNVLAMISVLISTSNDDGDAYVGWDGIECRDGTCRDFDIDIDVAGEPPHVAAKLMTTSWSLIVVYRR